MKQANKGQRKWVLKPAKTNQEPPKRRRLNDGSKLGVRDLPVQGAAVAYSVVSGSSKPMMTSSVNRRGDLRIRVRHREYVQDITGAGATTYGVQQLAINPGLTTLFPWLSQLANLFESYLFNKLSFQYRTETATSSTGKVILTADWDAADPAPGSKQAQLQERSKADGAVWQSFDLICDKQDLEKFGIQRYVRQGTLAANLDVKTYDVGILNVGTYGASSSAASGELYVEYDVELITPQTSPAPLSAKVQAGGTISNAALNGTTPVVTGSLPLTIGADSITFNSSGQYLLEVNPTGTLSAITLTGSAGATATSLGTYISTGSFFLGSWIVNVPVAGGIVTWSAPTGTVTANATRIAQYAVANA